MKKITFFLPAAVGNCLQELMMEGVHDAILYAILAGICHSFGFNVDMSAGLTAHLIDSDTDGMDTWDISFTPRKDTEGEVSEFRDQFLISTEDVEQQVS